MRLPIFVLLMTALGCMTPATIVADAGAPDAAIADSGVLDSGVTDAGLSPFDAGTLPPGPVKGELTLWQLDLPVGLVPKTGEAAVLVGPDGTLVVIDVGNSNHDDDVRAAVRELNTQWLVPSRGYVARAELEVDWVLLTHFHADHIGAFPSLASTLTIKRGVIHRGFVDVGPAVNETDFQATCTQLRGPLAARNFGLCTAAPESACTVSTRAPATGCPGLILGDLGRADDDAAHDPSFVDLGGGARLELLGAGGFMLQGRTPVAATPFGVTDVNEENARSVVGLVRHGAFRFLFAGDLSGSGLSTEPDLESFLVSSAPTVFGTLGVDVTHANHHARKTSSNAGYVQAAAPSDGRARSVIAGINAAYVNSPHPEALEAWTSGGRLGAGRFFVTRRALAGATNASLVEASGRVVLQTIQGGDGYWVQSVAAPSVRR